jgi:hypothetical protein
MSRNPDDSICLVHDDRDVVALVTRHLSIHQKILQLPGPPDPQRAEPVAGTSIPDRERS